MVGPNAGVGGSDVVRFKLVSSNASAAPLCLSVFGPPAPGEYSNSTTVLPCLNDTFADPFDPGAMQRFSFDRSGKGLAGNAILWEGDGAWVPACPLDTLLLGDGDSAGGSMSVRVRGCPLRALQN